MRHEDLGQTATSETDACAVFFRLLGLPRSTLKFHLPDLPYGTDTIEPCDLEVLPSAATMFQTR